MATRQYIGARYVPKFADPTEWDSANTYEPLTIVLHEGNSYTSKKNVPAGVDISNETYWVLTGNFNQQVASVQTQVNNMQTQVTDAVTASEEAEKAAAAATTAAETATSAAEAATDAAKTATSSASQANSALTTVGKWNAAGTSYTLNTATESTPGAIISGTSDNTSGLVVVNSDGTATVPVASADGYGIVKVDGTTITAANGVLSSTAGTAPAYVYYVSSSASVTGNAPGTSYNKAMFMPVEIPYNSDYVMYVDELTYAPVAIQPDATACVHILFHSATEAQGWIDNVLFADSSATSLLCTLGDRTDVELTTTEVYCSPTQPQWVIVKVVGSTDYSILTAGEITFSLYRSV